jgi:hypothetical protein
MTTRLRKQLLEHHVSTCEKQCTERLELELVFAYFTFIVLIASWASSIELIGRNSVVCGKSNWFTISILSPEVLMEVSSAVMDALLEN